MRRCSSFGVLLALFGALLGCSREGVTKGDAAIRSAADLKGRHVAHMSSDFHK